MEPRTDDGTSYHRPTTISMEYFKLVSRDLNSFFDPSFTWPLVGEVEVKNANIDGSCGTGLHLSKTIEAGYKYAGFPFRVLKVKPLGPILSEDAEKIRVAKAESIGEHPIPAWAAAIESRVKELPAEMGAIHWLRGTDGEGAIALIREHLELLRPFGFDVSSKIEVTTNFDHAHAAWDATWDNFGAISKAAALAMAIAVSWTFIEDAAMAAACAFAGREAWSAAFNAALHSFIGQDAYFSAASASDKNARYNAALIVSEYADGGAGPKHKNPFKPMWECWKLGAWPIGFVGDTFKIYVEKK